MSELKWYVVRVVSGQEKKIKFYLEKEIVSSKLESYLPQVLTPSEKVYQIRKLKDGKSKKVAIEKNFFPGYVIIQANLAHGELLHTVKNIPGVIGFLNNDTKDPNKLPQPMRETEINRILGKVEEMDDYEVKEALSYIAGEVIRVIDGPFNTFTGTVEEVFEDKKRLNVMVKIFDRNTPVELNYSQVAKQE